MEIRYLLDKLKLLESEIELPKDDEPTVEPTKPVKVKKQARLAPNGKPSNLNPTQYLQVRTPAFKAWFGDWENNPESASKVVDTNGEPMVMHHGTKSKTKFTSFNAHSPNFFTHDPEYAKVYSHGKSPISVFLNIKQPFDTRNSDALDFYNNKFVPYFTNRFPRLAAEGLSPLKQGEAVPFIWADQLFSALRSFGRAGESSYDGIYVDEGDTPKIAKSSAQFAIVPMGNTQIKSAKQNVGYNPESDNIHEEL
jgi:hypothetical protein